MRVNHLPSDLGRRLDAVHAPLDEHGPLRLAAVLALFLPPEPDHEHDGPRLLMIERSARLKSHAGQIAFPGGKPEPEDVDLLGTALREAEEEVRLDRDAVTILGRLEPVPTPTGFFIVPFVGRVHREWQPSVHSGEVARLLTPSLGLLSDPNVHRITDVREWQGRRYELHEFGITTPPTPPLWGATARMVWDLLERIRG
jgi:8-oxo-dGTP pyrophosphatase MutT (NUDIX family)